MKSPLIKICGITRRVDAESASRANIDFVGAVMVESSKRFVSEKRYREIFDGCKSKIVIVTLDMPLERLQNIIDRFHPFAVQLHGSEDEIYARSIRGAEVWKAFHLANEDDLAYAETYPCEMIVSDSAVPGSGIASESAILTKRLSSVRKVLAAGGITCDNALKVLRETSACGIDLSSGVETSYGIKSEKLIKHLSEITGK